MGLHLLYLRIRGQPVNRLLIVSASSQPLRKYFDGTKACTVHEVMQEWVVSATEQDETVIVSVVSLTNTSTAVEIRHSGSLEAQMETQMGTPANQVTRAATT